MNDFVRDTRPNLTVDSDQSGRLTVTIHGTMDQSITTSSVPPTTNDKRLLTMMLMARVNDALAQEIFVKACDMYAWHLEQLDSQVIPQVITRIVKPKIRQSPRPDFDYESY